MCYVCLNVTRDDEEDDNDFDDDDDNDDVFNVAFMSRTLNHQENCRQQN